MKSRLWGDMVDVQPEAGVVTFLAAKLQAPLGVENPAATKVFPGVPELSWLVLLGVPWEVQLLRLEPKSAALVEPLLTG